MAEKHSIVYIRHFFFIPSSINGHLSCMVILAFISNAAVNMGRRYVFKLTSSLSSDKYREVELLDCVVALSLTWGLSTLLASIVAAPVCALPPAVHPPHSCNNQECHQTLPHILWETKIITLSWESLSWMMGSCTTVGISCGAVLTSSLAVLEVTNFSSFLLLHLPPVWPGQITYALHASV